MKNKIEIILDEARYNGLPTHIVAEQLLDLFSVSQQRELLESFVEFVNERQFNKFTISKDEVNEFLDSNCG